MPVMTPYYAEAGVELYLGDCREVVPALGLDAAQHGGGGVALLWGDPPYGVSAVERRSGRRAGGAVANRGTIAREWAPIHGDGSAFDPAPWLGFRRVVLWGANHYADALPVSPSWWVWHKRPGMAEGVDFADAELAWTNLGGQIRVLELPWMGVVRPSENGRKMLHPTQKPEALASWGFQRAGLQRGDLVLSPWLGSGPEAAAAKRLGLRFVGVELVAEYIDACVARLRQEVLEL